MNGREHYEAAETLLVSCQVPGMIGETPEQYPAREDEVNAVGHALVAAQVHATLALAAFVGAKHREGRLVDLP